MPTMTILCVGVNSKKSCRMCRARIVSPPVKCLIFDSGLEAVQVRARVGGWIAAEIHRFIPFICEPIR